MTGTRVALPSNSRQNRIASVRQLKARADVTNALQVLNRRSARDNRYILTGAYTVVDSMEPALTASLEVLFWSSLALVFYNYAGYPVLVFLASRFFPPNDHPLVTLRQKDLPRVTVLIVACNAERHILTRIENVLACDYPCDRIDILVASDGSTDATVSLVEGLNDPQVRALAFSKRRGKTRTLVDAVRHVNSDVILFTDATNQFDRDSIRHLVRHFADPQIGIAAGKVSLIDEQGKPVESVYWCIEMMIRRSEMRLGIMLGANGPLYALRRSVFVEPTRPVINDDFVLPMLAHLRHGCGIVYDETARACMLSSGGLTSEFQRRRRIGAGAFQSLAILIALFRVRHAKQAIAFTSHKLLRWIGPFLLIIMLASSLSLASHPVYRMFFWTQAAAYSLAVAGLFAPNRGYVSRLVRICSSFLVLNLALLAGFFRWLRQPHNVVWTPTVRPAPGAVSVLQRGPKFSDNGRRITAKNINRHSVHAKVPGGAAGRRERKGARRIGSQETLR